MYVMSNEETTNNILFLHSDSKGKYNININVVTVLFFHSVILLWPKACNKLLLNYLTEVHII